jgi:prepilin-type N-terminal cleavage/methylation domain-containing protein
VSVACRSRGRGFSLPELIVSIGILSAAVLLVIGVFTYLFNASQKSVDLTSGTVVAEKFLAAEAQQIISDPTTKANFYDPTTVYQNTVLASNVVSMNHTEYSYTIYADDLNGMGPPHQFKQLSIICTWFDDGGKQNGIRQGMGLLKVELSRMMLYDADY